MRKTYAGTLNTVCIRKIIVQLECIIAESDNVCPFLIACRNQLEIFHTASARCRAIHIVIGNNVAHILVIYVPVKNIGLPCIILIVSSSEMIVAQTIAVTAIKHYARLHTDICSAGYGKLCSSVCCCYLRSNRREIIARYNQIQTVECADFRVFSGPYNII